jgi:hypothetical protein
MATGKTYFAGVGCESCHGPSSAHVGASDKKTGTSRRVPIEVCLGCHTPDEAAPIDLERDMKKVLGPGHGM